MAVVLGTNSGFVSSAPTADPAGSDNTADFITNLTKHTSPAGDNVITEIGWYCNNATAEANFEVGLYAADGAVVPGEAGTLLYSARTNAKGTDAGWKVVSVPNWSISASTAYWLAVQLDDTAATTYGNYASSGGAGADSIGSQSTLADPAGGGALALASGMIAIYALYAAGGGGLSINVYDSLTRSEALD